VAGIFLAAGSGLQLLIPSIMTPRERYLTALTGGQPDRVPVGDYLFSRNLQRSILGCTTPLYDGPSQFRLAHELGLDCMWVPFNGFCGMEEEPHAEGETFRDEWGVTYIKNGWPIMAQTGTPVKTRKDWEAYHMPPPSAPHRLRILCEGDKANSNDVALLAGMLGPFTMLYWYLMDLETLSMTIYDDPQLVHAMAGAYVGWCLAVASSAVAAARVDAFSISDDWGGTQALLMSPAHLREFFIPPMHRLVQGLRSLGKPVVLHNDGAIWDALDDLVGTGINGLHPIERAAGGDLGAVKRRYAGRLCPIGNVDNKQTMTRGTPDAVREEVRQCMAAAKEGGGYIIATDHSIHDGMPPENIAAYIDEARRSGVY
jgi:uroporphyrinogen decarboxylase